MPNSYSLDALREDIEKEFAPVVLTFGDSVFKLRNLMRIDDEDRNAVFAALEAVSADNPEEADAEAMAAMSAAVWEMLRRLPADGRGPALVDALDGDLALAMKVVGLYTETTQPGEATDSPS